MGSRIITKQHSCPTEVALPYTMHHRGAEMYSFRFHPVILGCTKIQFNPKSGSAKSGIINWLLNLNEMRLEFLVFGFWMIFRFKINPTQGRCHNFVFNVFLVVRLHQVFFEIRSMGDNVPK